MKKLRLTIIALAFLPLFLFSQDFWEEINLPDLVGAGSIFSNSDSLYTKLNEGLALSNSITSDIIWERIAIPDGKELRAFEVTPDNKLYIGCYNGGVYEYNFGDWELIGLANQGAAEFEVNSDNNLLIASYDLFVWDGVSLQFMATGYKNPIKNIYEVLFGAAGSRVVRSTDNGQNWDTVFNVGSNSADYISDFVGTSPDSIFLGTTNWVGIDGGIYLSTDGGDSWSHFGLSQHFIACLAIDNYNQVYAGNKGHYITGQGGLYRYNYETNIWDTIHYFPYITSIVFNSEDYIYTGFVTSGMVDWGGVLHSEDNGETWVLDTTGMGNTMVHELQFDNNGFLYALTGYNYNKKLYRTTLPVNIHEEPQLTNQALQCFPNPAEKSINIEFKANHQNAHQMFLAVSNSTGQSLINRKLTNPEMETGHIMLDISYLKPGFYIISITGKDNHAYCKFSKQ